MGFEVIGQPTVVPVIRARAALRIAAFHVGRGTLDMVHAGFGHIPCLPAMPGELPHEVDLLEIQEKIRVEAFALPHGLPAEHRGGSGHPMDGLRRHAGRQRDAVAPEETRHGAEGKRVRKLADRRGKAKSGGGPSTVGIGDAGPCASGAWMGVEKRGEDRDRLVVELRIGIEQEHLVRRWARAARACSTRLLPRPKPWLVCSGYKVTCSAQPLSWWAWARRAASSPGEALSTT